MACWIENDQNAALIVVFYPAAFHNLCWFPCPRFSPFTANWNQISTTAPFSLLLNRLPRLSFQPVFSLGSLPGKQEKHLNQWKMCLMVLGSTAAILQRYKTLQPRQLETTDRTALMKRRVKCGSNERKEGLIRVSQGGFYDVFYLRALILRRTWKSWGDRITFGSKWSDARWSRGPALQPFDVSTMQTTFQLPGRFSPWSARRRKELVRMSASTSVPERGLPETDVEKSPAESFTRGIPVGVLVSSHLSETLLV